MNEHILDKIALNEKHKEDLKNRTWRCQNPNCVEEINGAIEHCKNNYCKKFEIESPEDKFPKDKLIDLAKRFADEQEKHIEKGDYD